MARRALIGMLAGALLGFGYAQFLECSPYKCSGAICRTEKDFAMPTLIGSLAGLGIVFGSRWD